MNNKLYIFADGDEIGALVGTYVLKDDVNAFVRQSRLIREGNRLFAEWISSANGEVYNNEGDEIVGHIDPDHTESLEKIRQRYHQMTGHSISVGLGESLSEAGKALLAAKLTGKDKTVMYEPEVEEILMEAHQSVLEGTADANQEKIDDHYISNIVDDGQESEEEHDMMASPEDQDMYSMDSDPGMEPDDQVDMEETDGTEDMQDMDDMPDMPELAQDQEEMSPEMEDQLEMHALEDDEEEETEDAGSEYDGGFDEQAEPDENHHKMAESMMDEEHLDQDSDFENEKEIVLDGEVESDEDPEAEKADDMLDQPQEEMAQPEDLEQDLSGAEDNSEILQRVAQNLAMFKENKELMQQIKQAKPELYASILGLLQNMIDLAKMVDMPEESEQAPEATPEMQMSEGSPFPKA